MNKLTTGAIMQLKKFIQIGLLSAIAASISPSALAADITGAGSTFAYPILAKWAEAYKKSTNIGLNYQSIGSGGGIKQIKAKTVDFGASDMPLPEAELTKEGLEQFPAIMGGVVPVVNVEGIKAGQLKMTGALLANIYLGKITKWNAPEIAALNPGVKLPADDITVVHRADGSGTSFLWTDFLSKSSPDFKTTVGSGTAVKWPVGVGGKGNEGVAANVQRIKGAIGYVEYAYAHKNAIPHTLLKNKDGQFVQPDDASFKAAAAGANWTSAPGFGVVLTDAAAQEPGGRRERQGRSQVFRLGLQEWRRDGDRTGLCCHASTGGQADRGIVESKLERRLRQASLVKRKTGNAARPDGSVPRHVRVPRAVKTAAGI
jgi:phosphate transport system substrate-binding protein